MSIEWRSLSRFVVVLVLVLGFALPVLAQDDQVVDQAVTEIPELTDISPEEVGERGAELLTEVRSLVADYRLKKERLSSASEEDGLVLKLQMARIQDRFMAALQELFGLVSEEGDSPQVAELRTRVAGLQSEVTPNLWEMVEELRTAIDDKRAQRTEAAPADLLALEEDLRVLNTRLDGFVAYSLGHIQSMESMGEDVAADREVFAAILEDRSDKLAGRMALAGLRLQEFGNRLKDTPDDGDLKLQLLAARKSLDMNAASLGSTLDVMDGLGLPTDVLRAQLVTVTQDLASGLLDVKVASTLLRRALAGLKSWLSESGPGFAVKLLLFLLIMMAGRFLARLVSRAVEKSLDRANVNMSALLKRMTVTASKNAIMALALVFGLAQLGISLGPLLAGFGVVGFILGFAMQDSLGNLAAGMMILINRPYDVGDVVEISGVFGKVENMSMVSTSILTLDNQKLVVPNSKIWGDVIKNVTDQRIRRVDMVFGISYTDDIPHAEEVLKGILADHEKVLDDPEPVVRLHTLNESSVDFVVRPWVPTDEYWNVYWDVTRAVKMRFDEEKISIPFPQRDVHFYDQQKLPVTDGIIEDVEQDPVDASGTTDPDAGDS
jgi:small conductance mechanosensitive channel